MNNEQRTMNKDRKQSKTVRYLGCKRRHFSFLLLAFFTFHFSLFISCDHGQVGGADITDTYYPGNEIFNERMDFLSGLWYSRSESRLLDSYHIRKWSDWSAEDKAKVQTLFPSMNITDPKTYATKNAPQDGDYVFLYDDTIFEPENSDLEDEGDWGFGYMGIVRAVNIFNNDIKRGAVIIEYFECADPTWLSDPAGYKYQGLEPGEKPFFGIYFKVLDNNTIQMANAVDLAAMNAGKPYYTEQGTLPQAVNFFNVENEAEFISWGVVIPFNRE